MRAMPVGRRGDSVLSFEAVGGSGFCGPVSASSPARASVHSSVDGWALNLVVHRKGIM